MTGYNVRREINRKISRIEIQPDTDSLVVYEVEGEVPITVPITNELKIALKNILESIDGVIEVTQE